MSEPEMASAAAVAGLASEVEALRRAVDPVPGRIADLARLTAELGAQVCDLTVAPKPRAMQSWIVAPEDADVTRSLLAELDAWVAMVLLRYTDAATALPECWLWHPDIVEEVLWLMRAWLAAYQGEKASVALVADWHDRYRPGVVRRVKGLAGTCSLEVHLDRPDRQRASFVSRRPDAVGDIAAWWAHDRAGRGPEPTAEHLASPGGPN